MGPLLTKLLIGDSMETIKEELIKIVREEMIKINARFEACDEKHQHHNRRHDDAAKDSQRQTKILEQILETLKEHAPVFKRARDSQTTGDKLKEYFIWIAAMSAGGAGIHYWIKLFSGG